MSQTRPHIAKAFGNGAAFGACAFLLVGIASVFMGVPAPGFAGVTGPILGPLTAGAAGIIGFGTLAAATNVIVHTVPGLAKLLGEEHTGYQPNGAQRGGDYQAAVRDVDLDYLRETERDLYAADYLRAQNEIQDVAHHDRLIDEAIAQEEAMNQSMR